jgi:hypothetical protein
MVPFAVGAPISVDQMESPTQDYVDAVHEKYMNGLSELFYAHRDKYGHPNSELIIT